MEPRVPRGAWIVSVVGFSLLELPAPAGGVSAAPVELRQGACQARAVPGQGQPVRVQAEELTDQPARYLGRAVIVTAKIRRLLDPVFFTLGHGEVLGIDDTIPVVLPGRGVLSLPPIGDENVTVEGTFQRLRQEDLRRLDPRSVERLVHSGLRLEGRAVIIATGAWNADGLQFYPSPLTRDR